MVALSCLACIAVACSRGSNSNRQTYRMLIGTYTANTDSKGIYACEVDMYKNINLTLAFEGIINPSYLTLSTDKTHAYAVSEFGDSSRVSSFELDSSTGLLSLLNNVPAKGADPCYITATENHAITADYSSGSVSVFAINSDRSLSSEKQMIFHQGKSINEIRQSKPHVHQTVFCRNEKYLLVNDLGTDKVHVYLYNPHSDSAILTAVDSLKIKSGSGPRHVTVNSSGNIAYLLHELDGTVTVLSINENGKLSVLQEQSVVLTDSTETGCADIHISPDGKFLYATNRGTANDITCFAIDANGLLSFVEQISTEGTAPRNFAISPDGAYVFIANQRSNSITIFKRDENTGKLTDTQQRINVSQPVCICFYD